ncbi:hypothetical protein CAOG_04716 [Capsaspora owczarzaki ATCC 30864]|uniref:hypothetical protein n=1 Tax=Capsaspora owczarzaki (strain ATCC 30864) TaxID=595528 RepID=UPI0003523456|nr:hypothetical protein CAOG_04716 [Capsaspora owczarzaki ATCC 30864]|eukprot:XP_004347463.2 hypothetical protein CAOG_04716 [Capsaspora owczarzaki ATCC 30864]
MGCCGTFLLFLISFFLPPVGVLIVAGCGQIFLLNILLTLLGWIPGVIHAFYIIGTRQHPAPNMA